VLRRVLLLRDAVLAHALPCLGQLPEHVLPRYVAGAQDARADGEVGAVAPQPASRALNHDVVMVSSRVGKWRRGTSRCWVRVAYTCRGPGGQSQQPSLYCYTSPDAGCATLLSHQLTRGGWDSMQCVRDESRPLGP
jgi:hypothetical protein